MNKEFYTIIAGPCSISTKKELTNIFKTIYKDINYFRCGIWKARTKIDSFQGVGDKGLIWLRELQQKYNTPVAIEVGIPDHVEKAIKNNIRVLWIGARTTVNPFYVQELCNCLKGTNTEVWIKNPIYPDIRVWFSAIERFKSTNLKKIKIIHRGFFSLHEKKYRNAPMWNLLKETKRKFPELDLICDPSHIAGNKKYIYEISKKAISMNLNGLMIETHNYPKKALSDANQQINSTELKELIKNIKLNKF